MAVHQLPATGRKKVTTPVATLALDRDGLAKIRKLAKVNTDRELADLIGIDPGNLSRVLTGKSAPGPKFIAGIIEAFGREWFADLFIVVPDDQGVA